MALAIASGLTPPKRDEAVKAAVVPPVGWKAEPLKSSSQHQHQVWLSPSRDTAYGVVYFGLPWPVGPDLVLWGFMRHMDAVAGGATLLSEQRDDRLPGIRFVAEAGIYVIRTNLIVKGFEGWAVYAGTVRGKPVNESELQTAMRAREQTRVGGN